MRVAASDYDGTMCKRGIVDAEVLEAIHRWREVGNLFGIVTGRDLNMIRHETDLWEIPFDFLVCCNGAAVYGADSEELLRMDLDERILPALFELPIAKRSMHYELSARGKTYVHLLGENNWFLRLGIPHIEVSLKDIWEIKELQLVGFGYENIEEGRLCARSINEIFGDSLCAFHNKHSVDVIEKGISKAVGLEHLLELKGWQEAELFVIGDGCNDLPMIRRFSGFTVSGAEKAVLDEAEEIYPSVADMLLAHL